MSTPQTHDDLGRHVLEFLAGEAATGLPRGAALEAFRRRHGLSEADVTDLRAIVRIVEAAERPRRSSWSFRVEHVLLIFGSRWDLPRAGVA